MQCKLRRHIPRSENIVQTTWCLAASWICCSIEVGSQVCVIGNSFGLGQSLSCGIVSGKNRRGLGFNQIENFIQTDAAVNPGASGAPLVNEHGQLVGMVDAIYTKEADIDAGVNFAIDKKLIQKFLKTRSGQIN